MYLVGMINYIVVVVVDRRTRRAVWIWLLSLKFDNKIIPLY